MTHCLGVRPGGLVHIELHGIVPPRPHCTLGFLWRSRGRPSFLGRPRGARYISIAGHCVGARGPWPRGRGPVAYDDAGSRIGEVVYARWPAPPTDVDEFDPGQPTLLNRDHDFALIRLDHGVAADPAVCHFGGPTGINDDVVAQTYTPPNLIPLMYYGNGVVGGYVEGVGEVAPARTGVSHGLPDRRWLHFTGLVSHRDSGGPILTSDGRAVALIGDALGVILSDEGEPYVGSAKSPRLAHQVEAAEEALGIELELETAPFTPQP